MGQRGWEGGKRKGEKQGIILMIEVNYRCQPAYLQIPLVEHAVGTEGETLHEDPVKPALQDGGEAHPVERELEDDQVGLVQFLLLDHNVRGHSVVCPRPQRLLTVPEVGGVIRFASKRKWKIMSW